MEMLCWNYFADGCFYADDVVEIDNQFREDMNFTNTHLYYVTV